MARGRHAKQNENDGKWIVFSLIALLIFVQIIMLNQNIREKLSVVDFFEGQRIELEKK